MIKVWKRLAGVALPAAALFGLAGLAMQNAQADVADSTRLLVATQRRILILREAASGTEASAVRKLGQQLFFKRVQIAHELVNEVATNPELQLQHYREMTEVLDHSGYEVEDMLALRGTLEALQNRLPDPAAQDIKLRLSRIASLRASLGNGFDEALAKVPLKPGKAHGKQWQHYIEYISAQESAEHILHELEPAVSAGGDATPGQVNAAAHARSIEWNGKELPDHVVLLTFDDGPHPTHTPAILDILKAQGVHAIFFEVGRNLGEVQNGVALPGHNQAIVARLLREGHAVGNHTFTHPVLPKLDDEQVAKEIADTQALIDVIIPEGDGRTQTFRPPYGARNDKVLAEIDQHKLRSVIWNVDSEDWADPVPQSVAHRVIQEVEAHGHGIVLMHDIHAVTVEALPIIIAELKQRGYRFARWDGKAIVEP